MVDGLRLHIINIYLYVSYTICTYVYYILIILVKNSPQATSRQGLPMVKSCR
jgi:hypothetical protein